MTGTGNLSGIPMVPGIKI